MPGVYESRDQIKVIWRYLNTKNIFSIPRMGMLRYKFIFRRFFYNRLTVLKTIYDLRSKLIENYQK